MAALAERLRESDAIQPSIKVLSHELLFKPFRKVSAEEIERIAAALGNRELVAFLRDYAEDGAAWRARVEAALRAMHDALVRLDAALARSPWLSGEAFGLADVSWAVNLHRLAQARYALDAHPRLRDWYQRVQKRPSFGRGVEWRPADAA